MNQSEETHAASEHRPARRRWQFSLRRLIAAVAGIAVILAIVRLVATRTPLGMFIVFLMAIGWPWAAGASAAVLTCLFRGQKVQFQSDQFGCLLGLWSIFFWAAYLLGGMAILVYAAIDA